MKKNTANKIKKLLCLLMVIISVCSCITGAHASTEPITIPEDFVGPIPEDLQMSEEELAQIYGDLGIRLPMRTLQATVTENTTDATTTAVSEDLYGPIPEEIQMSEEELLQIYSDLGLRRPTRAVQGSIPDEMWDNSVLDALIWLGYNVNKQKEDGKLYDAFYTTQYDYANNAYGSGIPYDKVGNSTGCETVTSSTSPTGKSPKLSHWKSYGLCCASFASYYLINYLPNVEGSNGEFASALYKAITTNGYYHNPQSAHAWYYGLQKMINDGTAINGQKVQKFSTSQRAAALAVLQPGDVIIFTSKTNGTLKYNHVAIYIGQNADGKHWMANVSNAKGPGLDILEVYENYYDGKGGDAIFYHLPLVAPQGFIEIYKKDADNKALSGAEFQAVNKSTGIKYIIGPTNASGYAISEGLPVGSYTVTESKFPSGYTSSGTSSWTVSVTNGAKAKINAANKLINGYIQIYKKDTAGKNLAGAKFKAVNNSTKKEYIIGPTNDSGYAKSAAIPTGTYTVTETTFPTGYTSSDISSWTVTVGSASSNNVATINAVNKPLNGNLKIIKTTNTGSDLSGWQFEVYTNSAQTQKVSGSPFTSGTDGTVTISNLTPGTYYVQEIKSSNVLWVCDTAVKTVTVSAGKTAEVTINNVLKGRIRVTKTMTTEEPLHGFMFYILDENGKNTPGSPYVTGSAGVITSALLTPGTYTVKEVLPEDSIYYCTGSISQTVTVTAGEIKDVAFENALRPASISIKKTDPYGNPLSDARFLLEWSSDGETWQEVFSSKVLTKGGCFNQDIDNGAYYTDQNGCASWTGLHPSLYYRVTELEAPNGFSLLPDYAYVGEIASDGLNLELRVINSPIYTLPHTGTSSMHALLLTFACCLILGTSTLILLRRKKA